MIQKNEKENNNSQYIGLLQNLRKKPKEKKQIAAKILQLVGQGVDPNLSLKGYDAIHDNETAIMLFAKAGLLDEIKQLISKGAKIDIMDAKGQNLLHYAAEAEDDKILDYFNTEHSAFFKKNIDKEASNYKGLNITPLHNAAIDGNLTNVKYLLEKGADPLCINHEGNSLTDIIFEKQERNPKFIPIFNTLVKHDPIFKANEIKSLKEKAPQGFHAGQAEQKKQELKNSIKQEILALGKKIREDREERFKKFRFGKFFEAMDGSKRAKLLDTQLRHKQALNKLKQI